MGNLVQELSSIKVIDTRDIRNLKSYIDKKYSNLDSKKRSMILSNAVHQILDKFSIGFDKQQNNTIKSNILKNTIYKEEYSIYLEDFLSYYLRETDYKNHEGILIILGWINKHINENINMEEILEYLYKKSYITSDEMDLLQGNHINTNKEKEKECIEHKYTMKSTDQYIKELQNEDFNVLYLNGAISKVEYKNKFYSRIISKIKIKHIIGLFTISIIFASMYINIIYGEKSIIEENTVVISKYSASLNENDNIIIGQSVSNKDINPYVPDFIKYKDINRPTIKGYLSSKNSLLAEEPYFTSIINSSKSFNINPILLFSITGQEQGFVPKSNSNAKDIANNPFNVFHSWKEYNTNIEDSSQIAARTIYNICSKMTKEENVFQWINKTYAEDQNWWKGVQTIFNNLNSM